jgi:hypothetical protein
VSQGEVLMYFMSRREGIDINAYPEGIVLFLAVLKIPRQETSSPATPFSKRGINGHDSGRSFIKMQRVKK